MNRPRVLTIAGSDSSGGAGIQADLKTFTALGVYGASVITAVTAQNTVGVQAVATIEPEMVRKQLDSVFDDLRIDAVKIGMLGDERVIAAVADVLAERRPRWVVFDPVLVATTGGSLLDGSPDALKALLPHTTLLTPNRTEAEALLGRSIDDGDGAFAAAAAELHQLGPTVLLKGGHRDGKATDVLYDGRAKFYEARRIPTSNTHGTGCTLSSAIAARLALGDDLLVAVAFAKAWVHSAIAAADALGVGNGSGPVDHLWEHPEPRGK